MACIYQRKYPAHVKTKPYWWIKYYENGNPILFSTKTKDKKEALAIKEAVESTLEKSKKGGVVLGVIVREKVPNSGCWWVFANFKGKRMSTKIGDKETAQAFAKEIEKKIVEIKTKDFVKKAGEVAKVAELTKGEKAKLRDWVVGFLKSNPDSCIDGGMLAKLYNSATGAKINGANVAGTCHHLDGIVYSQCATGASGWRIKQTTQKHISNKGSQSWEPAEKKEPPKTKPLFGVIEGSEVFSQQEDLAAACADAMDLARESKGPVYVVKYLKKYKIQRVVIEEM